MSDGHTLNESIDDGDEGNIKPPTPLKISCTSTNCADNLHCFKATQRLRETDKVGACRACGVELVDWSRVHTRSLDDVQHTFRQLRREYIRHHFWHVDIDQRAIDHAQRKGRIALYDAAYRRLQSSVGRAPNAFDGRQTPFEGNAICYAQHATASCCRKCIEYWHGLSPEGELSPEAVEYLYKLVVCFLDERLPDLAEEGQHVPRQRA